MLPKYGTNLRITVFGIFLQQADNALIYKDIHRWHSKSQH